MGLFKVFNSFSVLSTVFQFLTDLEKFLIPILETSESFSIHILETFKSIQSIAWIYQKFISPLHPTFKCFLIVSIYYRHLHLPVYRCRECGLPFEKYLRSYIVQHVRTAHNVADIDACIEDNRALYRSQLYSECVRLFRLERSGAK